MDFIDTVRDMFYSRKFLVTLLAVLCFLAAAAFHVLDKTEASRAVLIIVVGYIFAQGYSDRGYYHQQGAANHAWGEVREIVKQALPSFMLMAKDVLEKQTLTNGAPKVAWCEEHEPETQTRCILLAGHGVQHMGQAGEETVYWSSTPPQDEPAAEKKE